MPRQVNEDLNPDGYRLLHAAVMSVHRSVPLLQALLEKGATPNTNFHLQPLHMACYYDAPVAFVEALLQAGAELSPKQSAGKARALHNSSHRALPTAVDTRAE